VHHTYNSALFTAAQHHTLRPSGKPPSAFPEDGLRLDYGKDLIADANLAAVVRGLLEPLSRDRLSAADALQLLRAPAAEAAAEARSGTLCHLMSARQRSVLPPGSLTRCKSCLQSCSDQADQDYPACKDTLTSHALLFGFGRGCKMGAASLRWFEPFARFDFHTSTQGPFLRHDLLHY
jgi:hypothetical protein